MNAMLQAWNELWYRPVAAVRPRLFLRFTLLLLTFDIWLLMVRRASRYGTADFNVSHFSWLDAIQPMPWPGLYAGMLLLVGGLALLQAILGLRRPLMIVATALYTYGWAMSLQDAYQHHYLISLVMLCFCLFPDDRARPRTTIAWGYQLLLATIGVVYAYAMISKIDSLWWSGAFLSRLAQNKPGIVSVVKSILDMGIDLRTFWKLLATFTILLEGFLSLAYVTALLRDRPFSRLPLLPPLVGFAVFFLAANMHLGIEVFGLRIGWFSYYMIGFAAIVFLPVSWLEFVAGVVGLGSRAPEKKKVPPKKGRKEAPAAAPAARGAIVAAVAGVACLVASGYFVDLPGALHVSVAAAVALVGAVAWLLRKKSVGEALRLSLVSGGVALVCWMSIANSTTHAALADWYRTDAKRRGTTPAAEAAPASPAEPADSDDN